MKNRVIAMLLCITTALGCLTGITVPVSAANTEGYYTYTVSNGEATITDVSTSVSGDVVIPDTLGGYPVVEIGYRAFVSCSRMTSITIPKTVTGIAPSFFDCFNLKDVYYCGSLKQWCELNLISYFPEDSIMLYADNLYIDGVKICGDLVIPEGVASIGSGAFYGCKELTSVTIPEGVTKVGISAFEGCTKLTSVIIPASVTTICESAFSNTDNIHYNGSLYQWCNINFEKIEYGWQPFASNSKLYIDEKLVAGDVVIPDGVTNISKYAFGLFRDITALTIPASVTNIEAGAVSNLDKLTGVWVSENNQNYCSDEFGVLFNKDKTELIAAPKTLESYTIPSGVTEIAGYAFYKCSKLIDIVIPEGVEYISDYTFYYCTGLESVTIPDGIKGVGMSFGGCKNLSRITFEGDAPDRFEIGWSDRYSFEGVTATAYYPAGNDTWTSDVMQDYGGDITWVPYEIEEETIVASGICGENLTWELNNEGTLTISGTGKMYDFCFDWDTETETINPWKDLKNDIETIVVNQGVTSIGDFAFDDCSNLTTVSLPSTLTSLGRNAFASCTKLDNVVLPDTLTYIDETAFYNCDSLTSITIPGNVKYIYYVFARCDNLTNVIIQEGVTNITEGAFCDCRSLTSIIIPDSVTTIGTRAFEACTSLTNIILPENLTRIDLQAFDFCSSLTSITIPEGVTNIGQAAFGSCTNLSKIIFEGDAPSIDYGCFDNVTATAYYPAKNDTWTPDVMQDYGGDITWVPYDDLEELKPGDIDGNGEVNRDDVVQLLLHISMPAAFPIDAPADFNGDGQVTRDDVIQLLLHVSMPDAFPL